MILGDKTVNSYKPRRTIRLLLLDSPALKLLPDPIICMVSSTAKTTENYFA